MASTTIKNNEFECNICYEKKNCNSNNVNENENKIKRCKRCTFMCCLDCYNRILDVRCPQCKDDTFKVEYLYEIINIYYTNYMLQTRNNIILDSTVEKMRKLFKIAFGGLIFTTITSTCLSIYVLFK